MVNLKAFGDRTYKVLIRPSVGINLSIGVPELAVALPAGRRALPFPAPIRIGDDHLLPKPRHSTHAKVSPLRGANEAKRRSRCSV